MGKVIQALPLQTDRLQASPMRKKILLITYHFPPSQAAGGLRIFNLAKHLPSFGWDTEVLTVSEKYLEHRDYGRLDRVQNLKIHRTVCLPTALDIYLNLKSIWYSLINMRRITPTGLQKDYVPAHLKTDSKIRLSRVKRFVISVFLALPDTERGWILPAVLKALNVLKKERFDFILTSCPPYSVHLIGLLLNKMTGIPWAADFRDPWSRGSRKSLFVTTVASNRIERILEGHVLKRADLVMTTTQNLCDLLTDAVLREFGQSEKKCLCQTNAYDEQAVADTAFIGKYNRFTITYTGSLYFGRSPEPVFKAVKQLLSARKIRSNQIKINLVGHCGRVNDMPTISLINQYNLQGIVEVNDLLPYGRSLRMVKKSHLALLLAPDQPLQIPAKTFDYIGAGTPILAIAQKGATRDLIQSTCTGEVFEPDDVDGIREYIQNSIAGKEVFMVSIPESVRKRFSGRSLAANVAEKINQCI